jgi:hypothetical protein
VSDWLNKILIGVGLVELRDIRTVMLSAGGWKVTMALQRSYLHADEQTMLTVVLSGPSCGTSRRHQFEPLLANQLAHDAFGSAKKRLSCCRITSGR